MRIEASFQSWPTAPPVSSYWRTCSSPKSEKSGIGFLSMVVCGQEEARRCGPATGGHQRDLRVIGYLAAPAQAAQLHACLVQVAMAVEASSGELATTGREWQFAG